MKVAEIRERAERRWLWSAWLVTPAVVLIFVGVQAADNSRSQSLGSSAFSGLVFGLSYGTLTTVRWRRRRRRHEPFAPLLDGLPAAERRAARRRIRRGAPSRNPLLREIETQTAQRLAAQGNGAACAAFAVVIVLCGISLARADDGWRLGVLVLFAAIGLAGGASWWRLRRAARRYLIALGE